jgi:hypothetical protein
MHRVGGCVNNRIDALDRQLEPQTGDEVALDPVVILAWLSAEDARAMSGLTQASHHLAAEGADSTRHQHMHD